MAALTVEELKKIAAAPIDPLKRSTSEMSVEENLEPPSVRKSLCKMLDNCSENELDRYLKQIKDRAEKIDTKMLKDEPEAEEQK
jgi:hypothetical protein